MIDLNEVLLLHDDHVCSVTKLSLKDDSDLHVHHVLNNLWYHRGGLLSSPLSAGVHDDNDHFVHGALVAALVDQVQGMGND